MKASGQVEIAPGWVTGMSRLVVAFTTYLMYEVFYAMQHIALGGLISAMAKDDAERSELSSARGIGGMLGIIVPQMAFPAIISLFESNPALGYGMGVTVCAIVGYICCLCCYFFTEERNRSSQKAGACLRFCVFLFGNRGGSTLRRFPEAIMHNPEGQLTILFYYRILLSKDRHVVDMKRFRLYNLICTKL